jgi:hypothetical protein
MKSRFTYANVTASIALFVALGGVSYAATALPANSVGSTQLKDSAVTSSKIANATITSQKLNADTIKALKGQTGDKGVNGTNGTNGTNGVKGDTGSVGPQGVKGDKGDQGNPGIGRVYSVVVDWQNDGARWRWVDGSGTVLSGTHVTDVSPVRTAGRDDKASVTFDQSIVGCSVALSGQDPTLSVVPVTYHQAASTANVTGATITWSPTFYDLHPVRVDVLCPS